MIKLLWAERQKIRRSKILWIAVLAVIMLALLCFVEGLSVYEGTEVKYGLKVLYHGKRHIDSPGWYMDEVELLAVFLVLPAVIALMGSYIICREDTDDTIKSLRLIPINEVQLTVAKMIMTFLLSVCYYLLLFIITWIIEMIFHASQLSVSLVLSCLKEYFLAGIGTFLAISPIIALVPHVKKGYWIALVVTEIYSVGGLLAGMSSVLKTYYPIDAIFNFSGYHIATMEERVGSTISLLLCGGLSILILWRLKYKE